MQCSWCQHENPAKAKFCEECAAPLARTCSNCGTQISPTAKFCPECASPVDTGTAQPRFASPGAYTPKHLAEQILASRSALEGERKQVTVLFCDIAGSTALAERIGAEAMHGLLNRFFELALAEVHRYEGTINQFLGDGFMALFGAPLAHEDHARRAALAALGIQRALREQAARFPGGFAVRMGLNTGPVVVGKIGDNLRMDYTAVGDTTNLAARLQQVAQSGDIYATEAIHGLVEPYVECESLGEHRFKGKAESVIVYRLAGARSGLAPDRGERRSISSPLVGREQELAALAGSLERLLVHGRGGIVGVLGDAGLGKSRLMTEASRRVADGRLLWLEGRALSFGRTLSYWPLLEILRRWAGITEEDVEEENRRKLERHVDTLFPDDAADVFPYLATLLGLPVTGELERRVKYLDGQAMGRQVFRSTWRLVERLATERPVVLVFEDLHWTDQSSAELIEHLFPLVEKIPLLICGVGRPERGSPAARLREVARSAYAERYTEIALSPLPSTSTAVLLDNLLANSEVPARLKELIRVKSEGNPFFVEEVVRALVAAGTLAWDARRTEWRATRDVEQITIPDTLQGVITARIDRLDEDVKHVLKVASIIGRSFFYRVLAALAEASERLDTHLDELQQVELIREKRRLPELEYFFKHALVQEATYETILGDRRRQLHRAVGECIEHLFADRLEEFYGLLAYHYASAEEWPKAQEYLFKAGDHAGRVAADSEALAHYQEASRAYERVFGDHWHPVERAILERKIGEALFRRGEHEQAIDYVLRARARLDAPLPTSRAGIRLAIIGQLLRQLCYWALPSVFLRFGSETAEPIIADELVRVCELMGWIDYFTNPERHLLGLLRALNFFERNRHPVGLPLQYMVMGLVCDVIPAFSLAESYHLRAVALAEQTGHPIAIGHAQLGLGVHEHSQARGDRALDHYQKAAATFREAGHIRGWGGAMTMLAWVFENRGDFTRALDYADTVIAVAKESSDPQIEAWALQRRAVSKQRTGLSDEAIGDLQTAIELSRKIPDYAGLAQTTALLGLCQLDRGHTGEALRLLEDANRVRTDRGFRGILVVWTVMGLAEASIVAIDEATAADRVARLAMARRACQEAMKHGRMVRPWLPMALRLRGMLEWREGKRGSAERSWRSAIAAANSVGARYDLARISLELGRCAGSRADLERAVSLFEEIGAQADLGEVRRLLASAEVT